MADARKFLYNSDYPMPYLVYFQPCNYAVGGTEYYKTISFAHNLPFTPLLVGQWSNNASFAPSYDLAMSIPSFAGGQPSIAMIIGADSSQVWIDMTNNTSSDLTYYFRLAAFPPSSYSGTAQSVEDASPYQFNSDFNYLKIHQQGTRSVAAGSSATVQYGLNYVPQTRIWNEQTLYLSGTNRTILSPLNSVRTSNGLLGATVSTTGLTLHNSSGTTTGNVVFHYQIYADEN